jgi:hypothetical protein
MSFAQELRDKLKPLTQAPDSVDNTELAWLKLSNLLKIAAGDQKGFLDLYLDTTLDRYSFCNSIHNYSAIAIKAKLEESKFKVEELEDYTDAVIIRITWDENYPGYFNKASKIGTQHFNLGDILNNAAIKAKQQ